MTRPSRLKPSAIAGIHARMSKLRFGICGLGFMGRNHLAQVRGNPHAEVVAVCDRDARRRAGDWHDAVGNLNIAGAPDGRAALAGVTAYATTEQLVADPRVDAVLIALPTPLHADVAVTALHAGKHVLCEKPMAGCVADCDRMLQAAAATGRTLMIGQCIRFWPHYETIQRCIEDGRIGTVRFMTLRRLGRAPQWSAGNWLLDGRQSGGALLDMHVHDVDFAQYALGLPEAILARGTRGPSGEFDHVSALWSYAGGRYVTIEGGWVSAAPWGFEMEITVHGERGTLGWALSRGENVLLDTGGAAPEALPASGDAYARQLAYFVECVQAGRPVARCLPGSTRNSIALAWLERRSIETGRLIGVSDRLRAAWDRK